MKLVRAPRWRDLNAESLELIPSKAEKTANYRMHKPPSKRPYVLWTSEDIRIFKEAADAGVSVKGVVKLLPGRSINNIETKLRRYRIWRDSVFPSATAQPWTPDQRATLWRLRQAGATARELLSYFPTRSRASILLQSQRLDPNVAKRLPKPIRKQYSDVEDELLRNLAARAIPHRLVAKLLNRSVGSISYRCRKIGALSDYWWTQAKLTRLSQLSKELSSREIGMQLGKTAKCITDYKRRWNREADPANMIAKRVRGLFRLTPERRQAIVNLRKQGCTWSDIQAQEFPKIKTKTLINRFIYLKGRTRASDTTGLKPTLVKMMSSDVVEHIQRLRNEGRTWREIGKMTFPDFDRKSVANLARRQIAEVSCKQSEQKCSSESESGGAS